VGLQLLREKDRAVVGLQVMREKDESSCGTTGTEREGTELMWDYR
jgi:hypothetical protein